LEIIKSKRYQWKLPSEFVKVELRKRRSKAELMTLGLRDGQVLDWPWPPGLYLALIPEHLTATSRLALTRHVKEAEASSSAILWRHELYLEPGVQHGGRGMRRPHSLPYRNKICLLTRAPDDYLREAAKSWML
jgi:hypothetical protein